MTLTDFKTNYPKAYGYADPVVLEHCRTMEKHGIKPFVDEFGKYYKIMGDSKTYQIVYF